MPDTFPIKSGVPIRALVAELVAAVSGTARSAVGQFKPPQPDGAAFLSAAMARRAPDTLPEI